MTRPEPDLPPRLCERDHALLLPTDELGFNVCPVCDAAYPATPTAHVATVREILRRRRPESDPITGRLPPPRRT